MPWNVLWMSFSRMMEVSCHSICIRKGSTWMSKKDQIRRGVTHLAYGIVLGSMGLAAWIVFVYCLIIISEVEQTPIHTIPVMQGGIIQVALLFGGVAAFCGFFLGWGAVHLIRVGIQDIQDAKDTTAPGPDTWPNW